jgi:hypothetical protein
MPYKDPEKRRAASRESHRRAKAGEGVLRIQPRNPSATPALVALRLETAQDAVGTLRAELERIITLCNGTESGEVLSRARTVAGLLVTFLRAVEVAELIPRLEALEARAEEQKTWAR